MLLRCLVLVHIYTHSLLHTHQLARPVQIDTASSCYFTHLHSMRRWSGGLRICGSCTIPDWKSHSLPCGSRREVVNLQKNVHWVLVNRLVGACPGKSVVRDRPANQPWTLSNNNNNNNIYTLLRAFASHTEMHLDIRLYFKIILSICSSSKPPFPCVESHVVKLLSSFIQSR